MEYPLTGTAWRKSSYSDTSGGSCVEVGHAWRKSSYSDTGGGNCVEVGQASGVVVRDTTDREWPALAFPAAAWRTFTATLV